MHQKCERLVKQKRSEKEIYGKLKSYLFGVIQQVDAQRRRSNTSFIDHVMMWKQHQRNSECIGTNPFIRSLFRQKADFMIKKESALFSLYVLLWNHTNTVVWARQKQFAEFKFRSE